MSAKFNLEQIRNYWTRQALQHGQSSMASWSDQMVIDLEIREILQRLEDGDRVLDIGCANGYSTVQFASRKQVDIRGLDYIPEMIELARARLTDLAAYLSGRVEFDVGDITSLSEPAASYDKVIVVRVLINLADWHSQLKGLQECARVLKPGGVLLVSEATQQGWRNLNAFRHEWGLSNIPMPPFNHYVDEDKLVEATSDLRLLEVANFSSTYYVGTRVLKPLLIQALRAEINVANPNMHWNRWFAQLPSGGNYGTQKLFVFQKTVS
jgi:ubiquinone/menaquinone biosynthesis C-methylase UbiE